MKTSADVRGNLLKVFVCLLIIVPAHAVLASCGTITSLEFVDSAVKEEVTVPIVDCDNPFNTDVEVGYVPSLTINDTVVAAHDTVSIVEGESANFSYAISPADYGNFFFSHLYQVTDAGYNQLAEHDGSGSISEGLSEGEYVAVFVSFTFFGTFGQAPSEPSWSDKIKSLFLPNIAHAFYGDGEEVAIIPFTIEHKTPEPTGASSVLFLPGIQASRLYTNGVLGTENQLWEPNRDNDVEKLGMTEEAVSVNDIYTKEVIDEIHQSSNIYKSFLSLLDDMQATGAIKEYEAFAYDWRYNVFDVATKPVQYQDKEKLLLEEVIRLAAESHTGKVTIIGHSNGGLVAKALLHEYGDDELDGLVDKIVMVGTPQLGTPKAVGSILHGLGQSALFGFLITQPTARTATRNMPGAYGLLPTAKYFASETDPFITYDTSAIASPVSSYGDFSTYENFSSFLVDDKQTRNEVKNVTQPIALNEGLIVNNIQTQHILDDWTAPDGVEVYEVAGTGNPTIDGFHYREFSCKENPHCILNPFLKPVPRFTLAGDETVVLKSATAYEGDRVKMVVDLENEGAGVTNKDRTHGDLTESNSVQTFLQSVIRYPYLTDTVIATEFVDITRYYKIIAVHSPVSITVYNAAGQTVGLVNGDIKEDIVGSSYIKFAGSKYVLVPAEEDVSVVLQGEADGRYSVTIEELRPDGQTLLQETIGATSTASLIAKFNCVASTCGDITADYDGDGEAEAVFGWAEEYVELHAVEQVTEEPVQDISRSQSSATRVNNRAAPNGLVAGISTRITDEELAQMWSKLLQIQEIIEDLQKYYNSK